MEWVGAAREQGINLVNVAPYLCRQNTSLARNQVIL